MATGMACLRRRTKTRNSRNSSSPVPVHPPDSSSRAFLNRPGGAAFTFCAPNSWAPFPDTSNRQQAGSEDRGAYLRSSFARHLDYTLHFRGVPMPRLILVGLALLTTAAWFTIDTRSATTCGAPVGSVTAYVGRTIPRGWVVADGSPLRASNHELLYAAIDTIHGAGYAGDGTRVGDFNLPDLRGRFLRGVDEVGQAPFPRRDPNAGNREAPRVTTVSGIRSGHRGDRVGSVQGDATARPTNPFRTGDDDPRHVHHFSDAYFAEAHAGNEGMHGSNSGYDQDNGRYQTDDVTDQPRQPHQHSVDRGGDAETRPKNVAVVWIVCVA